MELKRVLGRTGGPYTMALELLPADQEVVLCNLYDEELEEFLKDPDFESDRDVVLSLEEASLLIDGLKDAMEDVAAHHEFCE